MHELIAALLKNWVGESQARNRYDLFAKQAKKEGYVKIAAIFTETAMHEKTHAKTFFKMALRVIKDKGEKVEGEMLDGVGFSTVLGKTVDNLAEAIAGEHHEQADLYPAVADMAEKEGYDKMATQIRAIAQAETHHEARYTLLLEQIKNDTVWKKEEEIYWYCQECGYWEKGKEAPELCPSCAHPKGFFTPAKEIPNL